MTEGGGKKMSEIDMYPMTVEEVYVIADIVLDQDFFDLLEL